MVGVGVKISIYILQVIKKQFMETSFHHWFNTGWPLMSHFVTPSDSIFSWGKKGEINGQKGPKE